MTSPAGIITKLQWSCWYIIFSVTFPFIQRKRVHAKTQGFYWPLKTETRWNLSNVLFNESFCLSTNFNAVNLWTGSWFPQASRENKLKLSQIRDIFYYCRRLSAGLKGFSLKMNYCSGKQLSWLMQMLLDLTWVQKSPGFKSKSRKRLVFFALKVWTAPLS